jgi:nucleoside-diphosphate-sugar epimerase
MGYTLITGASGFVGKNLLRHLDEKHPEAKDKILILGSSDSLDYSVIPHKGYRFSSDDFTSRGFHEIDAVIHLGAFTPKTAADAKLYEENYSNVVNTNHLLHNLPNKPEKFVFISTLDVYQQTADAISEQTPTIPAGFYGKCKLFCEQLVINWCEQNNVIPQVLRLGHIYGIGEEEYRKLIPEAIRKIINNERPVIYTAGKEKRSFLHTEDCVQAIWGALYLPEFIGPVNIASSFSYSVKEIIQKIIDISGKDIQAEILNNNIETRDIVFDNGKMCAHFGEEQIDIGSGLTQEYKTFNEDPESMV